MKIKQETLQLTAGNNKRNRRELDFYPTPSNVTIALLEFLQIPKGRTIWEPACGDGSMSKVMEEYGYTVFSTDIIPECYGDGYIDYLASSDINSDCVITNPPFYLAEEFIRKAVKEARSTVAILLKSQYWHAKSRLTLFEEIPPTYVLPLTWRPDFLEHERKQGDKKGAPTMEVAWSVWQRGSNHPTLYKPLKKP